MKTRLTLVLALGLSLLCTGQDAPAQAAAGKLSDDALRAAVQAETATHYAIIFDTSGSMAGNKLSQAENAFTRWLATVQPGNVWSLYRFDKTTPLRVLSGVRNGQDEVARRIREFKADSGTPLAATLGLAFRDTLTRMKQFPYETPVVLVFTDGAENVARDGNQAVTRTIANMRANGIQVVSIGYAGEGRYMEGVASRYYQADSAAELAKGLAQVECEIDPMAPVVITDEDYAEMAKAKPQSK